MLYKGFKITIEQDQDAESPDNWGDDSLFLVTSSNRYFEVSRAGFDIEDIRAHKPDYHILPLVAYIHSGVALSLGNTGYPFNDPWDSGQIGFVLVRKRAGYRNIRKAAAGLVESWNMYLSGDVWYFAISEAAVNDDDDDMKHVGEILDSCCGFYGHSYCVTQAKEAADGLAADRTKVDQMQRNCFAL